MSVYGDSIPLSVHAHLSTVLKMAVERHMKVLGYFCEAEKKGSRSSLVGKTNKSCHTLHACSNIELVMAR